MLPPAPPRPDAAPAGLPLLLLLTAAAYAALALAGFVFDDVPVVVDNTLTGAPGAWWRAFAVDLWEVSGTGEASGHYRPLLLLSLVVDRALWGLSAAGHHLHSVAWHLATVAALHALLRRLVPGPGALVGAALFALHPLQSEAVAFVAARNDPMVACFVLLGAVVLLPEAPGPGRLGVGFALGLAALGCKESGVILGPLLVLLDLARWGRLGSWRRYAALALALGVYLGARRLAGVTANPMTGAADWGLLLGSLHQLAAHSALRVLWPWPLTVGHSLEYLALGPGALALGLGGGVGLAALLLARGGRLAAAGLGLAAGAFAPSLLAIVARGQLGERYYYLALAGLALAVAAAWPRAWSPLRVAPLAALALYALHLRLPDWASDLTLWQSAARDAPSSYTLTGLAHAWNLAGQPERACPLFAQALEDERVYGPACFPAVNCPLKRGEVSRAAQLAERTEQVCAPAADLVGVQALAYAHFGLWERAQARVAAAPDPQGMSVVVSAAALALRAGDPARAAALAATQGEEAPEVLERARTVLEVAAQAERWRQQAPAAPGVESPP